MIFDYSLAALVAAGLLSYLIFLSPKAVPMLMNERRFLIRALQGRAISVLLDAGSFRNCEEKAGCSTERTTSR